MNRMIPFMIVAVICMAFAPIAFDDADAQEVPAATFYNGHAVFAEVYADSEGYITVPYEIPTDPSGREFRYWWTEKSEWSSAGRSVDPGDRIRLFSYTEFHAVYAEYTPETPEDDPDYAGIISIAVAAGALFGAVILFWLAVRD